MSPKNRPNEQKPEVVMYCRVCPGCPNISINASTGSMCNDSELVIREPSTVEFHCSYDASANTTVVYTWYLDDAVQPGTSPSASIAIPSGTHVVKCRAQVNKSPDCMCDDFRTLTVTVVGKQCRIFIPHICVHLFVCLFIYLLGTNYNILRLLKL